MPRVPGLPRRDDRRLLAVALLAGGALALMTAVAPRSLVEVVVNTLLPSSGGGGMREALLSRHRLFFGGLSAAAAVAALGLPYGLEVVRAAAETLERPRTWVFLATLVALVVLSRVALSGRMLPIVPGEDPGHFFQLASTLLEEGRFIEYNPNPDYPYQFRAWRLPGFPFALAGAMLVFGKEPDAVLAVNTLWTIVLVLSIYLLVRRLGSEAEARVAAVLCAFYPALVEANLEGFSALQYASLTAVGAWFLFGEAEKRGGWWVLAAGCALGLAALTRGNGLLLWLMLLVAWPVYRRWIRREGGTAEPPSRRVVAREVVALAAGFVITITPWTVRNYLVLDAFVPLATNGGANMWLGHNPGSSGLLRPETRPSFPRPNDELAMSEYGFRNSVRYWLDEPVENLKTGARIVVEILKVDSGALGVIEQGEGELPGSVETILWTGFNLCYYALWGLALFWGLARLTGRWISASRPGVLLFVAVAYVLTYVPFIGRARYKVPALPFLVAAASMVLVAMALPGPGGASEDVGPEPAGS